MKSGGPAFPLAVTRPCDDLDAKTTNGMSLRQYAAIKAMQALVQRGNRLNSFADDPQGLQRLVKDSYDIADAMIKKGKKK